MKRAALSVVTMLGVLLAYACESHNPLLGPGEFVNADVRVVQRVDTLPEDLSVTTTISRRGGIVELPEAGLRVVIPANAVILPQGQDSVDITVTAIRGRDVAYEFAPHGLRFRRPIIVHQDARVTEVPRNNRIRRARGAYFTDRSQLDGFGGAHISEIRPTDFKRSGVRIRWSVDHFSGYLLAIG